jgi:hypothetical protein
MKKLVTAFALCAAISAFAVDSQNIVGYKTEQRADGAWIQSVQFDKVGGNGSSAYSLSNVLNYASLSNGDQLWVFDVVLGDYLQYSISGGIWYDTVTAAPVDVQVFPGAGLFLITANNLIFAGQVPSTTSSFTHTFNGDGAYLVGAAFPASRTLAKFNWSTLSNGDQLWLFDAVLGDYLQYSISGGVWYDTVSAAVLPMTTTVNDGFFLITGATQVVESL